MAKVIEAEATRTLVVVALGPSLREDYTVELARELVKSGAPELLGLFVENAELLEHASSRQAREILMTGEERHLDRVSLERQLRSQAERARTNFEAVTGRLGIQHRFEVARGNVLAEIIRRAQLADALVADLGQLLGAGRVWPRGFSHQLVEARLPRVLLAQQGWFRGKSVAVLLRDIASEGQVLGEAATMARRSGSPLAVLVASPEGESARDLAEAAREVLAEHNVQRKDLIWLTGAGTGVVSLAMRACRPRMLVLPTPSSAAESQALDDLMRRFAGALMLVRA